MEPLRRLLHKLMAQLPKKRYDENIKTRNFRLRRTMGTRTKFTLDDKRTGMSVDFDAVRVGCEMGRGDTIQLYVDDAHAEVDPMNRPGRQVGSIYQHDVCDHLLEAFEHIEQHGKLPEADYVKVEL